MKNVSTEMESVKNDARKAKCDTFVANILSVTALGLSVIALMVKLL